ncbi:hypothetical protein R1sor_024219 [Riccia sorocarpa]|uniref:Uncharacterized protein n=1 Tax=Riccia sorocarpa TaxID=122646 RepID=A0ABD3GQM8_9MARC
MSAYPNVQSVARNSRPVLFLKRYLDEYSLRMSSAAVDIGPHESRVSLLGEGGTDNASHKSEDGDSRASSSPHMVKVLASASIGLLLLTLLVTESVVSGSFLGHSATAASSGATKPGVGCEGYHFVNAEVNNLQGFKISPECAENIAKLHGT